MCVWGVSSKRRRLGEGGGTAEPRRTPLLTGRRRARSAPGTRAPAGRRRCGQRKEKRGSFNTRGLKGERQRRLRSPAGSRDVTAAGPGWKGEGEGGGGGIRYQREQLRALSSRPSAARVRAQEGPGSAMGVAVRGWPHGAGRLPERPRSTSRMASRHRHYSKFPARHHCASAESCAPANAHARPEEPRSPPPSRRASRASGAGRGQRRGGAAREGAGAPVREGLRKTAGWLPASLRFRVELPQ